MQYVITYTGALRDSKAHPSPPPHGGRLTRSPPPSQVSERAKDPDLALEHNIPIDRAHYLRILCRGLGDMLDPLLCSTSIERIAAPYFDRIAAQAARAGHVFGQVPEGELPLLSPAALARRPAQPAAAQTVLRFEPVAGPAAGSGRRPPAAMPARKRVRTFCQPKLSHFFQPR